VFARCMIKRRSRVYMPRIVGGKVMPADLVRLHKYLLEIEHIDHISDETISRKKCGPWSRSCSQSWRTSFRRRRHRAEIMSS